MEIAELQQRLSRYPEIVAAYLFGSAVTGKLNPMSDVDIAILLRDQPSFDRELLLSFDVISRTSILNQLMSRRCRLTPGF